MCCLVKISWEIFVSSGSSRRVRCNAHNDELIRLSFPFAVSDHPDLSVWVHNIEYFEFSTLSAILGKLRAYPVPLMRTGEASGLHLLARRTGSAWPCSARDLQQPSCFKSFKGDRGLKIHLGLVRRCANWYRTHARKSSSANLTIHPFPSPTINISGPPLPLRSAIFLLQPPYFLQTHIAFSTIIRRRLIPHNSSCFR